MPSEQEFSTENQNQEAGDAARTGAIPLNDLPPVLRNWQVIEIDGEATRVDPEPDKSDEQPAKSATVISDHPDDLLVASLESRALTIDAGDTATFQLSLLNNGDRTALFQVSVEGWIHEQWLTSSSRESATQPTRRLLHALLHPGERTSLQIDLRPPRASSTQAGDHAVAFVVRAAEYPNRFHRLVATLTIAPYADFELGSVQPSSATVSWFKRVQLFSLPITNLRVTAEQYIFP